MVEVMVLPELVIVVPEVDVPTETGVGGTVAVVVVTPPEEVAGEVGDVIPDGTTVLQ